MKELLFSRQASVPVDLLSTCALEVPSTPGSLCVKPSELTLMGWVPSIPPWPQCKNAVWLGEKWGF